MLVRVVTTLSTEVQAGQDLAGSAVCSLEHPHRARISAPTHLVVGRRVDRVDSDLEAADDLLADTLPVVDLGEGVDAPDNAVCDFRGAAALDDLVTEFRLAQFFRYNADLEDLPAELAILDRRHRAVPRDTEMGALQGSETVEGDAVVIVRAGLHDCLTQGAVRAVQHVPVTQDIGGCIVLVEDDAADGAGRDLDVSDTRPGHDRVETPLAHRALGLGDDTELRRVAAFDDVSGDLHTSHLDRRRELGSSQRLQFLRLGGLHVYRELQRELLDCLTAPLAVADANRGHIRVEEVALTLCPNELPERGHKFVLLGCRLGRRGLLLGDHGWSLREAGANRCWHGDRGHGRRPSGANRASSRPGEPADQSRTERHAGATASVTARQTAAATNPRH
ncbi:hypothetical protein SUDANB105_07993 [Streptomyces sp. enrichment culture]